MVARKAQTVQEWPVSFLVGCFQLGFRLNQYSKQVLGHWIIVPELPENFPIFSQNFKGVVDRGVLFPSRLAFIHCLFSLVQSGILLHQ